MSAETLSQLATGLYVECHARDGTSIERGELAEEFRHDIPPAERLRWAAAVKWIKGEFAKRPALLGNGIEIRNGAVTALDSNGRPA